jgi:hypothetical protein
LKITKGRPTAQTLAATARQGVPRRDEHEPSPVSWGEILGDTTVAAAMLDRLLHRSVVLNLDGDSYRLRDHHARAEKLRSATTGTRQPLT